MAWNVLDRMLPSHKLRASGGNGVAWRSSQRLLKISDRYAGLDCELDLDGVKLRGRYLLVEILNMGVIGPNLPLAPRAAVSDSLLDVVCIEAAQCARWKTYVEQVCAGEDGALPVRPRRCHRVELHCSKPELHVDDEVFGGVVGRGRGGPRCAPLVGARHREERAVGLELGHLRSQAAPAIACSGLLRFYCRAA